MELIRDRIVMGVATDLSEYHQSKANLTLHEAMQPSAHTEARKEGQPLTGESGSSASSDTTFITKRPGKHTDNHHHHVQNASVNHHNPSVYKKWMYCGGTNMLKTHAQLSLQHAGHTQSRVIMQWCRSCLYKTVHQVSDTNSEYNDSAHFLGSFD